MTTENLWEKLDPGDARPVWLVNSTSKSSGDQFSRFISEGIWELGFDTPQNIRYMGEMEPGDFIAIKYQSQKTSGLPFENKGRRVSTMIVKAIGTIAENPRNGKYVKVKWSVIEPPKEWYFFTLIQSVWKLQPRFRAAKELVDFIIADKHQDLELFLSSFGWGHRYGFPLGADKLFEWTNFYESFADKLLTFKDDRVVLLEKIYSITAKYNCSDYLTDTLKDGSQTKLDNICPFTVFGIFNRGIKNNTRTLIASELGEFLGVTEPPPTVFGGIPVLNNQNSWFFRFSTSREEFDIKELWDIFEIAIEFADSGDEQSRQTFITAYDNTPKLHVAWKLTMGLYWIRPFFYPTFDSRTRDYLKSLQFNIKGSGPAGRLTGKDYLSMKEALEEKFTGDFPAHSFPELSLQAWNYTSKPLPPDMVDSEEDVETAPLKEVPKVETIPYTLDSIVDDGCFIPREKLETILYRLKQKKNLILQGPPGTGKTWLAKRLAYALIGKKDHEKIRVVQFHPNMSYEDFIQGYRPANDDKLETVNGPFMEMIEISRENPEDKFAIVIEEINRGNPAQILGEMLTLLEADKRNSECAIRLTYQKNSDSPVYIPDNLYIIGTMNIADRSLAIVDHALRRRFAFINLEPIFGDVWKSWMTKTHEWADTEFLAQIERRLIELNDEIQSDSSLGAHFKIGHSFVTPSNEINIDNPHEWFVQVIETEIGPLLDEYWFDDIEKSKRARNKLRDGL